MRFLLACIINCVCFCTNCMGQQPVQVGEVKKEPTPVKGIYRFSEFREGTIIFRNGLISAVKFNYDISRDQMHFIDQRGDTLMIAYPDSISFISLNGSRFYYDNKGYLQTISTTDGIILAFKQKLLITVEEKDMQDYLTRDAFIFFTGNGQKISLGHNKMTVSASESYFFGDENFHFTKTGKQFILDRYKNKQAEINSFLKTYHTNFNRLEDLLALLQYCSKLSS